MWLGTSWLSNLIFTAGEVLIWLVLGILVLLWYEPRLIFYPHIPSRALAQTPEGIGIEYEEVQLQTSDNIGIHGWFLSRFPKSNDVSRTTLLFFHGNAGNISHRLSKCRVLVDLRLDVLLIDYRGYGQSEGRPREAGTYRDADVAYEYLRHQRHLEPEKIVIYGESLGTGVAVDLASRVPVGGVILEAAFTSIPEVAKRLFRGLPVNYIVRNRYDSLRKMRQIEAPCCCFTATATNFFPWLMPSGFWMRRRVQNNWWNCAAVITTLSSTACQPSLQLCKSSSIEAATRLLREQL